MVAYRVYCWNCRDWWVSRGDHYANGEIFCSEKCAKEYEEVTKAHQAAALLEESAQ